MRAIDRALVERVWSDVAAYAPERVAREAQAFLRDQPAVTAFCQALTHDLPATVQQAALGLGFLFFKVLEASLEHPFPALAETPIARAWEEVRLRAEPGAGADAAAPDDPLGAYLLERVFGGPVEAEAYDNLVRARLAALLAALARAVDLGTPQGG